MNRLHPANSHSPKSPIGWHWLLVSQCDFRRRWVSSLADKHPVPPGVNHQTSLGTKANRIDSTATGTVLIAAALLAEIKPTISRLALRDCGDMCYAQTLGGTRVVAAVTGVGGERATRTLERIIERDYPSRVILAGFAGGLDPSLRVGDLIQVREVIDDFGGRIALEESITPGTSRRYPSSKTECCDPGHEGRLLTMDGIAGSVARKRELYEKHRAGGVDMESYHVAVMARRLGVALTILRAVSDTAVDPLPEESTGWTRPDGRTDVGAVVRHLVRRPWEVRRLARLGRDASVAAEALAKNIEEKLHEMT